MESSGHIAAVSIFSILGLCTELMVLKVEFSVGGWLNGDVGVVEK